jgi:hypothetical protein
MNFVAPMQSKSSGRIPQVNLWSSSHAGAIARKSQQSWYKHRTRAPHGAAVCSARPRTEITALVARNRLPTDYPYRQFAEVGGLLPYGNDPRARLSQAATLT